METKANTKYEPFDFYRTKLDFLWTNNNEEYLKLSDYGITDDDVWKYKYHIEEMRKAASERHTIYEHRSDFFRIVAIVLLVILFFFVIGHFNDFMREGDIFYDILLFPVYGGFAWVLYKYAFPFLSSVIDSVQKSVEAKTNNPVNGHPDGHDARVEKYFSDLLWKIQEKQIKES